MLRCLKQKNQTLQVTLVRTYVQYQEGSGQVMQVFGKDLSYTEAPLAAFLT